MMTGKGEPHVRHVRTRQSGQTALAIPWFFPETNPLAIGYASLSAIGDTVRAVTVGGVECSEETVKDGSYEVQRPFVFVTNDSVTLSAQAQAFFDFAASTDAADLIRTAGAVPVNE